MGVFCFAYLTFSVFCNQAEFPDHCLTSAPSGIFIATCVINLASQQVSLEPVGTSGWRLHFASGGCLDAFSSVAVPCVSAPVMTLGSSSLFQVHSESLDTCLVSQIFLSTPLFFCLPFHMLSSFPSLFLHLVIVFFQLLS